MSDDKPELNTEDAPTSKDADVTDPGYIKPPREEEKSVEPKHSFLDSLKHAFESGSRLVAFLKVSGLLTALGLGAWAEVRSEHAKEEAEAAKATAEVRTAASYETLREEIEALWEAQEADDADIAAALAELALVREDVDRMGLQLEFDERLEAVEDKLRGRAPRRPERPSVGVADSEGPPRPDDFVERLERDVKRAEAEAKRAKKKKKRKPLKKADDFFKGQEQQIEQQILLD